MDWREGVEDGGRGRRGSEEGYGERRGPRSVNRVTPRMTEHRISEVRYTDTRA